jgi:type I restriction enzyme M protein
MAVKKSELYSSLWKSCDELRGGMDASQYKDYVLVLLFVKYVSDKAKSDQEFLIDVPNGGSFNDMIKLKGKAEIGDGMNKIISKLAEANELKGVIDVADFNDSDKLGSGKDMQNRLSNLVAIFENPALDFSKNRAEDDDLLGDAYEYLMRHFATESGKSKGQFYTPAEVSRIMAKVIEIEKADSQAKTVYDPTCGSGSLLLKAASETKHGITIYGQENDVATRGLAKMNMILHNNPTADIWRGNTISAPHFKNPDGGLKTFDYLVANPPFSSKNWSNGIDAGNDEFGRFEGFGIPPKKNGDYAFLLHMIKSLKSTGKAAVILPQGVLFRSNSEGEIRKNIVKRGYIKGIIGLPSNLFFGTGIPACIIVIDKENAENRKGIFMIDASKGFYKDGNKNRLRSRDIHKIVDVFTKQLEIPKYSRMVPHTEIYDEKNDYNLNMSRYLDSNEEEDKHDINAHLNGDIPKNDIDSLEEYWKIYPSLKKEIFSTGRKGYYKTNIEEEKIKPLIFSHKEFVEYSKKIEAVFEEWKNKNIELLKIIKSGDKPKELIYKISEDILNLFSKLDLIDKYSIYQHLMNYWSETMQDDVYMIVFGGWKVEINILRNKSGKEIGWDCDLIPKSFVIEEYFSEKQGEIDQLNILLEEASQNKQDLEEENSGDEDLFADSRSDAGKITKGELSKRIKEIKNEPEYEDELKVLQDYLELINKEADLKKQIKEAESNLDKKLLKKYKILSEKEIKKLVIENKWFNSLKYNIDFELEQISKRLAERIIELMERYNVPLSSLIKETTNLNNKVENHLEIILKQLLLGKMRLPGYDEDWKKTIMYEIVKEIANRINWRGLSTKDYRNAGPIMLTVGNVKNTGIDFSVSYKHITREKYEDSPEIIVRKGDILLTKSGTIGRCCLVEKEHGEMTINSAIIILRMKELIDSKFFTYLLQSKKGQEQILSKISIGAQPNIFKKHIVNYEYKIPPSEDEQKAISEILSDVDAEIECLDKTRKKYLMIKEGLMDWFFNYKND